MSSLDSIRSFVKEFLETEERLDILINNAGVAFLEKKYVSADGLEWQMVTNYLGPFLLTNLLMGILKKSAPSRIVNVTSYMHHYVEVDLKNFNSERYYDQWRVYPITKLLLIYMAKEMTERLAGSGVTCNCARPSGTNTELMRHLNPYLRALVLVTMTAYVKSAEEGAQSIIYASASEDMEKISGKVVAECKVEDEGAHARDMKMARSVWDLSVKLTRLKPEEVLSYPTIEDNEQPSISTKN